MPELPEVEMARRYLQATALHQTIQAAKVKDGRILARVSARELEEALAGQAVSLCFAARQEALFEAARFALADASSGPHGKV